MLYSEDKRARYHALRRDLGVLTQKTLRQQRHESEDTGAASDRTTDVATWQAPVVYHTSLGRYTLRSADKRQLRLSPDALEALAVIARGLHGGVALPGGRELFAQLADALADDERGKLTAAFRSEARPPGIALELGPRENIGGLERVVSSLWRAWRERQTVKFSYRARGGVTEHFNDEVLEIWLGDHAYASLWCEEANKEIPVRLDRIVPDTLHPAPKMARGRRPRRIPIRYRLDAEVARGEVTERLEGQTVAWEADGGAIVSGHVRSLFWAEKVLLRYGAHARALEPPALVAALRRTAERMHELYALPEKGAAADGRE